MAVPPVFNALSPIHVPPGPPVVVKAVYKASIPELIDNPVLLEIARCESRLRQFDSKGNVLRGLIDHDDTGLFQINRRYHLADSRKMGLNIDTIEGNIAYGKYLYSKKGTQPWNASKGCWS